MNPITAVIVAVIALIGIAVGWFASPYFGVPIVIAAVLVGLSLKMANTWQRFVILRAGNLQGVKGPGLF